MSWVTTAQIAALLGWACLLVCSAAGYIIDKVREDAHHRKENGL